MTRKQHSIEIGAKQMSKATELPLGIKALRRFRLGSGIPISRSRFERLIDGLNRCASDGQPKLTMCDACLYRKECVDRFDAICNRVGMTRGKGGEITL